MKKLFIIIVILGAFYYKEDIIKETVDLKNNMLEENVNIEAVSIKKNSKLNNTQNINKFSSLSIGDDLSVLKSKIGEPGRIGHSEYNFKWYIYNQYNKNFGMVGVQNEKIVALYSNSINSQEIKDIKLQLNRDNIRKIYKPLKYKKKGNTRYVINSNNQYDIIKLNDLFVTVFYDIHDKNKVCSYQIISEEAEKSLNGIYAKESEELKKSFELQVVDLANSVRLKSNLTPLDYSEKASKSSLKHSKDMNINRYFEHENKNGESPFDRMKKEGINYNGAGENIAAGQTSAIYAHEAWMNSIGHRKNILGNYKYLGVGVDFGGSYRTYFTQNFYI